MSLAKKIQAKKPWKWDIHSRCPKSIKQRKHKKIFVEVLQKIKKGTYSQYSWVWKVIWAWESSWQSVRFISKNIWRGRVLSLCTNKIPIKKGKNKARCIGILQGAVNDHLKTRKKWQKCTLKKSRDSIVLIQYSTFNTKNTNYLKILPEE